MANRTTKNTTDRPSDPRPERKRRVDDRTIQDAALALGVRMAGAKDGWFRLAKRLTAKIDPELIEAYRGTISRPLAPGDHCRAGVAIIDDRGIEPFEDGGCEVIGIGRKAKRPGDAIFEGGSIWEKRTTLE